MTRLDLVRFVSLVVIVSIGIMVAVIIVALVAPTSAHPLDGLTKAEIVAVSKIMRESNTADNKTLFPLITLLELSKSEVLSWTQKIEIERRATVHFTNDK
jgi:Cu2+-containing amine oxidase